MAREHIFTHPSQLNGLSTLPFTRTSGLGTLRLGGELAEHPERKKWEAQLNRAYYACGCDTSAALLTIGLLLGSAWSIFAFAQKMMGGWAALGFPLLCAVGGAVVGKLIGLLRANTRLQQIIQDIQGHWQVDEKPEDPQINCG
jgi:hypothetical protein